MRRFFFLSISFSVFYSTLGQQPASEGVLEDAEFVIKKERKVLFPKISRSFERAPTFIPKIDPDKPLEHSFLDLSPEFDILPFKIRLLRAKPDVAAKRYSNYLQGGCGTTYMPSLEGYFASKHHAKYTYGLQVRHLSAGQVTYAEEMHNLVQLHGKLFTKSLCLGSEITYSNDKYPLYIAGPSKALSSQTLHQVEIHNTLTNYVDAALNYQIHTAFHYLCYTHQVHEYQGEISGKGDYAVNNILKLKACTDLYFTQHNDDTKEVQHNLWRLKPIFSFLYSNFNIEGGINLVCQNDASYLLNPINVYPVLSVKYARYRWLQPYVGVGGDIQRNDLCGFLQENPLLASRVALRHTNQRFVFYGGAQGSIKEQVAWHVGISAGEYQNLYCLVNSNQDPRRFEPKYDAAARLCNLFCEFNHTSRSDTFSVRLRGDFFYYVLQELTKPWHRPCYQLDFLGTYRLNDKLAFKCTMHWIGGIKAWDATQKAPMVLQDVLDAGLGINYWLSTRFYAFCNFHNLLNRKNERYLHYPSRGFHLMAGISYAW